MPKESQATLDFDRALDAYSSQAKSVRPRVTSQIARYTAAAGAALALGASADAAIQYTYVGQYFPIGSGTGTGAANPYWIDFNNDSIDDLKLTIEHANATSQGVFAFNLPAILLNASNPARLASGQSVGPAQAFSAPGPLGFALWWAYYIGAATTFIGNWTNADPGFLGVAVPNAGSTNYAWVRLSISNDVNGIPIGFAVTDWAYETTPDTALALGGIPEPSPITGLALLATGAAGIGAWRRRKKAKS